MRSVLSAHCVRSVLFAHCVLGILLLGQSTGQEPDSPNLETQLRMEAPAAWKRLEAKHARTRFDWNETHIDKQGNEVRSFKASGSNCYRGEDFLVRIEPDGSTRTNVWGGNDRYIFTVTKARDANAESWRLSHFSPRVSDQALNGDSSRIQSRMPWTIFDVPLYELILDPTFEVKSLRETPDKKVELTFAVSPGSDDSQLPELTSGRVTLLPERNWAISSYEANVTRRAQPDAIQISASAEIEYGPEEGDFLNVTSTKYELSWQSNGKQMGDTWETEMRCQPSSEPREAFTLASFGLPEPALAVKRTSSGHETPLLIKNNPIAAIGSRNSEVELSVSIFNRGERAIRIIGAATAQACRPNGCLQEVSALPTTIPAKETRVIQLKFKVGWPDQSSYVAEFYTDCNSQPVLNATIQNSYVAQ